MSAESPVSGRYFLDDHDAVCALLGIFGNLPALGSRLARLVEAGVMERREYRDDGQRARVEYPLTDMGQSLDLSFTALTEWSDRWIGNGSGPLALR